MRFFVSSVCGVAMLAATLGTADAASRFNLDANSPVMQRAVKRLEVDESRSGAGPSLKPGRTFYVVARSSRLALHQASP